MGEEYDRYGAEYDSFNERPRVAEEVVVGAPPEGEFAPLIALSKLRPMPKAGLELYVMPLSRTTAAGAEHGSEYLLRNPLDTPMRAMLGFVGRGLVVSALGAAEGVVGEPRVAVLLPPGSAPQAVARVLPGPGLSRPEVESVTLTATAVRGARRNEDEVGGVRLVQTLTPFDTGEPGGACMAGSGCVGC